MLSSTVSQQPIPTKKVTVDLELPEPIVEAITAASVRTNVNTQMLFNQITKNVFMGAVEELLTPGPQPQKSSVNHLEAAQQELKSLGIDLGDLKGQMGELQQLVSQLNQLKEVFANGATGSVPGQSVDETQKHNL